MCIIALNPKINGDLRRRNCKDISRKITNIKGAVLKYMYIDDIRICVVIKRREFIREFGISIVACGSCNNTVILLR